MPWYLIKFLINHLPSCVVCNIFMCSLGMVVKLVNFYPYRYNPSTRTFPYYLICTAYGSKSLPDFVSTYFQFIILPSMGNICSALDNWRRGDAIGEGEAGDHFTGKV